MLADRPARTARHAGAKRVGLFLCLTIVAAGCPSFSTLQLPTTVPRNKVRETIGFELVQFETHDRKRYVVPQVELGTRLGVTNNVDVGFKLSYAGYVSAEAGFKVQLLRGPLDLAVAPAASAFALGVPSNNTASGSSSDHVRFLQVHLPILMGVDVSDTVTIAFGPKFLYSNMVGNFSSSSNQNVLIDGTFAGGFVSLPIEVSRSFWIAPEANVYESISDPGHGLQILGGLALFMGGHDYIKHPDNSPPVAPPQSPPAPPQPPTPAPP